MAESSIEWTEKTWNPVVGCTMVSPGCAHCYAETMAKRLKAMALADLAIGKDPGRKRHYVDVIGENGKWNGKLAEVPEALADPFGWKYRQLIFVNSMSDLFHESLPFEFVDRVFGTMYQAHWHTFQALTKRADRMEEYFSDPERPLKIAAASYSEWAAREPAKSVYVSNADVAEDILDNWPLPNVWLGVSVEREKEAHQRIGHLIDTPAAVRFLSIEPILEEVHWLTIAQTALKARGNPAAGPQDVAKALHWVIVGGESGPGARACDVTAVRHVVRQCKQSGVACFVKQFGAYPVLPTNLAEFQQWPEGTKVGNPRNEPGLNGRVLLLKNGKGGDPAEWPAELQVRQWPAKAAA
jgi:protein gp37